MHMYICYELTVCLFLVNPLRLTEKPTDAFIHAKHDLTYIFPAVGLGLLSG